ncbi:unnamed protein product [marine sediment metagenome]|uniref:Uncharacterized protein n=1 Tax=marine sediment metagenome TaxID=412755 RepID=X1GVP1_9ZZZZ
MSYDKYRNWKSKAPHDVDTLRQQVLKDIHEAEDEIDKLEILDSFEAYVERSEQEDLAEHFAFLVLDYVIRPLLVEFAKSKMPGSMPISRSRAASIKQ